MHPGEAASGGVVSAQRSAPLGSGTQQPWPITRDHFLPVHPTLAALDTTTPPAMASAYARALPAARLHMLEGEGHLSLPFRHNKRILGSVAESAVSARI